MPCTEFSRALTTRPRNLDLAARVAQKALEIIRYFQPAHWWIEIPRYGLLPSRPYMQGLPFADVDYSQYRDWGYQKPTRIWGDAETIQRLKPRLCDGKTCRNLDPSHHSKGKRRHRYTLSHESEATCTRT